MFGQNIGFLAFLVQNSPKGSSFSTEFLLCRWIQMARRILSSSKASQSSSQNQNSAGISGPGPQSSWRSTIYPSSRIAPASAAQPQPQTMSASRSEANLPSLRLPDGGHHPSLDHYNGQSNGQMTMLKTKVWYHSQRNVQEASV